MICRNCQLLRPITKRPPGIMLTQSSRLNTFRRINTVIEYLQVFGTMSQLITTLRRNICQLIGVICNSFLRNYRRLRLWNSRSEWLFLNDAGMVTTVNHPWRMAHSLVLTKQKLLETAVDFFILQYTLLGALPWMKYFCFHFRFYGCLFIDISQSISGSGSNCSHWLMCGQTIWMWRCEIWQW